MPFDTRNLLRAILTKRAQYLEASTMVTLRINGKSQKLDVPPDMPLLWVLRDVLGTNGTKFGCGVALCGACTVHLDGIPRRSCVMPASAAVGHAITTIEAIGATPILSWRENHRELCRGGSNQQSLPRENR